MVLFGLFDTILLGSLFQPLVGNGTLRSSDRWGHVAHDGQRAGRQEGNQYDEGRAPHRLFRFVLPGPFAGRGLFQAGDLQSFEAQFFGSCFLLRRIHSCPHRSQRAHHVDRSKTAMRWTTTTSLDDSLPLG